MKRDGLAFGGPAAPVRQKPEKAFRWDARFAEGGDARVTMPLGKAEAVRPQDERDVEECVGDSPFAEGYVFEEEGSIVGYAMLAKSFSTEFGKACVWIEDIYVEEEYRGKGIGSAFLAFASEKYAGCLLRLEVEKENARAWRTYEKNGFTFLPYAEMKKE